MPTKLPLGRLEQIRLREAWENEAGDFTPWLATTDNIKLLGDAVDMELEVEAIEQHVGPFRADIVCRNLADDSLVLIENQIERTDHNHLGQLLTYAAGLEAVTVIWIAERFQDEHRAALDWLNTITEKKFNFFGLEIELWQIGGSPAAPKFNVVCKPNEWVRRNPPGPVEASPIRLLQQEYWTAFNRFLVDSGSKLKWAPPGPKGFLSFALGRSGFGIWAIVALFNPVETSLYEGTIRAQLTIEHPESVGMFNALLARKDDIERQLGEPLVWMEVDEGQRRQRILLWTKGQIEDRADWPRQHKWLKDKVERMHAVFLPIVRELQPMPALSEGAAVQGT
jgi:hypothetical protein